MVIPYICSLQQELSPKHLLSSLCYQIDRRYHSKCSNSNLGDFSSITNPKDDKSNCCPASTLDSHHEPTTRHSVSDSNLHLNKIQFPAPRGNHSDIINPDISLSELKEHFSSLLSVLPSPKQPLVLILDGLDQTENNFIFPQIIGSLPSPLPPCVKLILGVSSSQKHVLQAIKLHYPQSAHCVTQGSERESGCVCIHLGSADRKEYVKMLKSLLTSSGRTVTSGQQFLVNQALGSCGLSLYTPLLHVHTSLWSSGMIDLFYFIFIFYFEV